MQKQTEVALKAAIDCLMNAIKTNKRLERTTLNRLGSLYKNHVQNTAALSIFFVKLYKEASKNGLVWKLPEEQVATPPVDTATASIEEASETPCDKFTILKDANGKVMEYVIPLKSGDKIVLPRHDVERMMAIYANSTIETLLTEYPTITPGVMKEVLKALSATKENIVPPHILMELTSDEIDAYIINARRNSIIFKQRSESMGLMRRALNEEYKKGQTRVSLIEEFRRVIDNINFDGFKAERIKEFSKDAPLTADLWVAISDIHFGKRDIDNQGNMSDKHLIDERLAHIVSSIKNENPIIINLLVLGDLLESPMFAGMHGEQFKKMEMFGSEQIMYAMESMERFIISLQKAFPRSKINVHMIGGNHDRFGHERGDDVERTGSAIIAKFLAKLFQAKKLDINVKYYDDGLISLNNGYMNVIAFHGDNNLVKKSPVELQQVFAKNKNIPSVIISGHYHSFKVEENSFVTRVQLGSICSNDKYERYQLGVSNEPSALTFYCDAETGINLRKISLPKEKKVVR